MLKAIADAIGRWNYPALFRSALRTTFPRDALRKEGYFSQWGQDKWLVETVLPGLRSGLFVDIGAHDGVTFSNTLYLERQLGWTGLAVEPIPEVFERLQRNRSCLVINMCVGPRAGKAAFQVVSGYSEMLSGLMDEYDERHICRIQSEIETHGGGTSEIEVVCCTLNQLLELHGIDRVDYLCIDVEGAEYSILNTFDFSRCQISVISVENNYRDRRIPRLLEDKGFRFHSTVGDEFYVRHGLGTAPNHAFTACTHFHRGCEDDEVV